jgi:hypothetical protein
MSPSTKPHPSILNPSRSIDKSPDVLNNPGGEAYMSVGYTQGDTPKNQPDFYASGSSMGGGVGASPGNVSTFNTSNLSTTSRFKSDPVREVLSQFLDIYQTDQDLIKKKLEELSDHPIAKIRLQELSDHPVATIDSISAMQSDIDFIELDNSKRKQINHQNNIKIQENRKENLHRDEEIRIIQENKELKDVKNDQKKVIFNEKSEINIEGVSSRNSEIYSEMNKEMNVDVVGDQKRENELYERYSNNDPKISKKSYELQNQSLRNMSQDSMDGLSRSSGSVKRTEGSKKDVGPAKLPPWMPVKSISPTHRRGDDIDDYTYRENNRHRGKDTFHSQEGLGGNSRVSKIGVSSNSDYRKEERHRKKSLEKRNTVPISSHSGGHVRRKSGSGLNASNGYGESDDEGSIHTTTTTTSTGLNNRSNTETRRKSSLPRSNNTGRNDHLTGAAAKVK